MAEGSSLDRTAIYISQQETRLILPCHKTKTHLQVKFSELQMMANPHQAILLIILYIHMGTVILRVWFGTRTRYTRQNMGKARMMSSTRLNQAVTTDGLLLKAIKHKQV